ncbi:MAG TPA: shikimate dehydrogenase [Pyrinomonadaceae bacterium]|jgi:3-dehydroquinate dehydratase/shikimate dehydrogenase
MSETNTARICIPVCEERASGLRAAIERAAPLADLVELRLDYLQGSELFKAMSNLPALINACPRPVVVTLRPVEQGGRREMDNLTRIIFWGEHFLYGKSYIDFADIELDLALFFRQREQDEKKQLLDWDRVICSHHDFAGVPADLEKIYERMATTPARILKIAVGAHDATDCLPVFRLLERARLDGRELIALAMNEAGVATRILGPSRGAFMTYGAPDVGPSSAPGQASARDLRELYRVDRLDGQTQIMGLVGSPVTHSISPQLHNAAFAALGINAVYIPFEVRDAGEFIRRMAHPRSREAGLSLRGLSVTAPHKSAVMEHLDQVETAALEIGAVNTILIKDGELRGSNTDAAALIAPLLEKGLSLQKARCAVIGAGGAARSALWSLRRAGAQVTLLARDEEKAHHVVEKLGGDCRKLDGASFSGYDLVVNATPLGTHGLAEEETPALAGQLRGVSLVYDLVYNPAETRFMREAVEAGSDCIGGLGMLVAQAAAQFKLWTGRDAPLDVMKEAAGRALAGWAG